MFMQPHRTSPARLDSRAPSPRAAATVRTPGSPSDPGGLFHERIPGRRTMLLASGSTSRTCLPQSTAPGPPSPVTGMAGDAGQRPKLRVFLLAVS